MFIYFLEQVWCLGPTDWVNLNWETREIACEYWSCWHALTRYRAAYPAKHMEEGNDYLDY